MSTQQHGLAALVARLERVTVKILGQEFPARLISGDQQRLLLHVMPPPSPPLVADPTKGSLAPKIPDDNDAGYLAAYQVWTYQYRRAVVGLSIHNADPRAMGVSDSPIPTEPSAFRALAERCADVLNQVPFEQVTGAHATMSEGPEDLVGSAEKN